MTTARTLTILTCVAASAMLGSSAEAKKKKKPEPAAAPATEAPATEEAGSIAPGSAPDKSPDSAASSGSSSETSSAADRSEKSEKAEKAEKAWEAAGDEPAHVEKTTKPALKMEAPPPAEAPPPPPPPVVVASATSLRKASGNADSPEGVTWKASGWDVTLYGYAGVNIMQDSTQSFGTASSNTIIQHLGTPRGNNLQAQATARDSRIGLRLAPPQLGSVRASVNIETDFNAPPPIEYTEANSVTNAGLRMRHYYMKVETPVVDFIAGQYHDLFGWGGKGFYPSTLAFLGITGEIYHRKPQVRLSKTVGSDVELEVAVAALAPVQKSGGYPDVEAGIRLGVNKWTGARQQAYGQPGIGALGIGVSGIGRHFEVANFIENPSTTVPGTGWGVAGNVFIPVIPATSAKDRGNALSLTGEYSIGTGISDMYSDLTGGLLFPALGNPMDRMDPTNPPPVYTPNIDSGIVTFDGDRRLRTANWQGFVANLQYYLPIAGGKVWIAATHSEIKSTNIQSITPMAGWGGIYTHSWYNDGTLFVAITDQIQVGVAFQRTHQWLGPEFNPATGLLRSVPATNYRSELGMHMFF
ncbi:MAG TPA: hypothetical protein VHL80_05735 [Polyangia bacterium]|nr:hypothetical protein [Polyangia bacterium]